MVVELRELVEAGVYPDNDAALRDALRVLWQERPAVRVEVAVHRYRAEDLSISKAAAIAGVSFDRMKEILANRNIPLRLGPETAQEAINEVEALRDMLQ